MGGGGYFDSFFPGAEAGAFLAVAAVEEVVAEGDAHACGSEPGEAVLSFLEQAGVPVVFVVVEVVVRVVLVARHSDVLILVGVVLAGEEPGLYAELQSPVSLAAEWQYVAQSYAGSQSFADPSSVFVEADAEESEVRVGLEVESPEGGSLAGRVPQYVAGADVVAGLQLVVADLEELVLVVVLPPGSVEAGSEGEVPVEWEELQGDIGYGAPAVVARHVGEVEEQVALDGQHLAARLALGKEVGGGGGNDCGARVLRLGDDEGGDGLGCLRQGQRGPFRGGLFVRAKIKNNAGGTQGCIVVAE